jgi:hypothetical protein
MTQNHEDLPIEDDELDKRTEAVNEVAAKVLPMLLADFEEVLTDKNLQHPYEIDFLGDLYARMIVSVFMGYYPDVMGEDAIGAAHRFHELAKEHDNDEHQGNT